MKGSPTTHPDNAKVLASVVEKGTSGAPWYVVGKDVEANTLIVAQGRGHPALYALHVSLTDLSWISGVQPQLPLHCTAKIRYRQAEQHCTVISSNSGRLMVTFRVPQWAPAPGQSVVFYDARRCLGGGVIETVSTGQALDQISARAELSH